MSIETIACKGSAHYRAVVRIGRKRVSKTFSRKIDAKRWEAETRAGGITSEGTQSIQSKTTLDELMKRFEKEHCEVRNAPSTRIMNRSLYSNYLEKPFGDYALSDLTCQLLESYLIHLRNDKYISNGRVNRVRQLLHVINNRPVFFEFGFFFLTISL